MRTLHCIVAALCVLLSAPSLRPAHADVPSTVPFQGRLTAPNGQPVADTDTQTLTFRLYDAATGGTPLWSQTSGNVHVRGGGFSVTLDFSTGFTDQNTLGTALAGTPYVEVQAGDDPPMSPRLPLSSAPYALRARTADLALTVPDGSITAPKLTAGAVSSGAIDPSLADILRRLYVGRTTASLVSTTDIPGMGFADTMVLSGGHLYVTGTTKFDFGYQAQLELVDVTGPVPILEGPPSPIPADTLTRSVTVSGGKLYTAGSKLMIMDVSDPTMPNLLGSATLVEDNHQLAARGNSVAVRGDTAYIAAFDVWNGNHLIQSFDVSDPTAPLPLGVLSSETMYAPSAISIAGDLAYIAGDHTLRILDVSTPGASVERGMIGIDRPRTVYGGLVVSEHLAYVCGVNGLQIIDVSNPSTPRWLSTTEITGGCDLVAASGTTACVICNDSQQMTVLDVSNPSAPAVIGTAATNPHPVAVALSGHTAYVLSEAHTLQVPQGIDVAGPASFGGDVIIAGNLGIGATPTTRLDVNGTVKATGVDVSGTVQATGVNVNGSVEATALRLTTGAAAGRVLTSDANGVATWEAPAPIPAIVSGEVNADATINIGSGFTVTRMGGYAKGGYHITFTTPFLATPIVTVSPYAEADGLSATYANTDKNGVDILVTTASDGFRDTRFSFIAVGTR